jgi:hypothetical protein
LSEGRGDLKKCQCQCQLGASGLPIVLVLVIVIVFALGSVRLRQRSKIENEHAKTIGEGRVRLRPNRGLPGSPACGVIPAKAVVRRGARRAAARGIVW